ncbi:MAG: hypothetical protein PW844_19015 [Pantoea sp.]|uniref:hypothetical protein n=1 Tax=Pantoea sp. TaxID=69393 RepID=UPI0023859D55|nr:hypothetical protein [Pantoea sp.]MDE1188540.1 hypothetical protein [Pantoea sp.]
MIREKDIAYENGKYWVLNHKSSFHVMKSGITHATCDSNYATLDLAVARCDYLAKKEPTK